MDTACIELHYLPCTAYFSALSPYSRVIVEKHEHYEKQTYRNRCHILGPHRTETLIVPVTGKAGKAVISTVRIDYSQKWLNNHWRTLRTGYGKAPYFEYYAQDLHDILFKKPAFLYDLNLELLTMCLKWLESDVVIEESRIYEETISGVSDLRNCINPKKPRGCNRFLESQEYPQVFGSKFVPNLSLVDLVFNQGPGAGAFVKRRPSEQ